MAGAWRKLHKVLGLSIGGFLFLVFLSGSILVFKEDIIALSLPSTSAAPPYRIADLSQGLSQIISHHEAGDIYYIKTPTQGRRYWLLVTRDEKMHLYDGDSAEPIADPWRIQPALHWLSHFHTELLLPSSGTTLLTLIGIFTLVLMFAGFISWWPGRRGFRFQHLWTAPTRRGPALRQHRALAVFCIPLLLLSVVTGGGMSVQSAWRFLFPATPVSVVEPSDEPDPVSHKDNLPLEQLLRKAQRALPDSEITLIGLPSPQRNQLRLRFRMPGEWHINGKTNVLVDAASGQLQVQGIHKISFGRKLLNTFYPLHSSYGLSGLYKTIVALTGVLSVWLAVLGYMAWLKRRGGVLAT